MSATGPDRPRMIESLMDPAAYPDLVDRPVERIATHISDIFLAGDYAYKVKKPVDLGFCDFSTPELRKRFSERELELNQRLSHDVYLSVEPVKLDPADGKHSIGQAGGDSAQTVDWALKMRRLDADEQLDRQLEAGKAGADEIKQIALRIAEFHSSAPAAPPEFGTVDAVSKIVLGNLDRVKEHAPPELDSAAIASVSAYASAFLKQRNGLIANRCRGGKPRMCHGDLHAGNIFLEHAPSGVLSLQVIDCIEFNDSFVYIDPAADIAFLSMDLKRRGRHDLAQLLIETYVSVSGDSGVAPLLPFYESYRAMVRCMAASMSADQAEPDHRQSHVDDASSYLRLACEIAASDLPQFLVITAGVTGTGKSTVARIVARQWNAVHLQTDAIRRELAGIGPTERSGSEMLSGIYTPEMSRRTYEEMRRRAAVALDEGRSVIMDGTHLRRDFRKTSLDVGRRSGAKTIILECTLFEPEAVRRLESRYASGTSESEGRPEVHAKQSRNWQPPTPDEADALVRVDTSVPEQDLPAEVVGQLWDAVLSSGVIPTTGNSPG